MMKREISDEEIGRGYGVSFNRSSSDARNTSQLPRKSLDVREDDVDNGNVNGNVGRPWGSNADGNGKGVGGVGSVEGNTVEES